VGRFWQSEKAIIVIDKMQNNKPKYLISFVLCGRNDDYLGDFKYRLTTTINYLCRNVRKIGRLKDIEVIIVDWNSETPLAQEICIAKEINEACKFICVPPATASEYNPDNRPFNSSIAPNVGIARADGEFILIMPSDILFSISSLYNLFLLLEKKNNTAFDINKTMMNISRKMIPWQIVEKKPCLFEWDRYLQLHNKYLDNSNYCPGLCHGIGAILMNNSLWKKAQGLNENLKGWGGNDVDIGLRINQFYPSINLDYFGINLYDMQQRPEERQTVIADNPKIIPISIEAGNLNWGLKNYKLEIQRASCSQVAMDDLPDNRSKIIYKDKENILSHLAKSSIYNYILHNLSLIPLIKLKNEWACLYPLFWYTKNYLPKKYLEFGIRKGYTSALIASINHSVEIYGIDEWNSNEGSKHGRLPGFTSSLLLRNNFKGYAQFVTGDKDTAFKRLKQSFIGHMSFDLILFRIDIFGDKSIDQLKEIMNFLEDNGALVVIGKDTQLFKNVWEYIQKEFPEYIHIVCKKYNTGFMLKCKTDLNDKFFDYEKEEKILTKAWKPRKWKLYMIYFSYVLMRAGKKYIIKVIKTFFKIT
jgi:hypothetical protein